MAASDGEIAEIRGWIGADAPGRTDIDIQGAWVRLGSVARVSLEFVRAQRTALLSEPVKLGVDGTITEDRTENLKALNAMIDELRQLAALDDVADGETNAYAGIATVGTLLRPDRGR